MTTFVIRFELPTEIPASFDGRDFCVPYSVVDRTYLDSPRERANTVRAQVRVAVSGTTLATWHLDEASLIKSVFQIAKEHIEHVGDSGGDIAVASTAPRPSPGPCPYDISKIEDPAGALMVVDVHRPIGFVTGA